MAIPGSIYGRYKIVDELSRPASGPVCTAVLADDLAQSEQSQTYVVKVYDPDFEFSSDDADLFLKKAEVQQQASASGKNWGPIHESGRNGEGKPFYVTNYYPRSAQKLISGKVALPATGLQEIIYAIISGLLEMKQTCARSHGNIKPSNILIGGRGAVADAKVVLCDPSGDPCVGVDAEAEDVRAVGGIIYQLVMHRPFPRAAWPVADAEQWKRLGRWRELCSKLLDPNPSVLPTLADVERDVKLLGGLKIGRTVGRTVKSITGPKLITKRRMILAAAVLAVAGAGVGVLRWEDSVKGEVAKSKTELDNFLRDLDDPANKPLFESGSYLAALQQNKAAIGWMDEALAGNGWKSFLPATIQNLRKARSATTDCREAWKKAYLEDPLRANLSGNDLPLLPDNATGKEIVSDVFQLQQLWAKGVQAELTAFNEFLKPLDQNADLFASGSYLTCLSGNKTARELMVPVLVRCRKLIDSPVGKRLSTALGSTDFATINQARSAADKCRAAWIEAFAQDVRRSNLSIRVEDARKRGWKLPNEKFVPELPQPPTGKSIVDCVGQLDTLSKRLNANDPTIAWNDFEKKLQGIAGPGLYGGFAMCLREETAQKIALAEKRWDYPPDLFEQNGAIAVQIASIMKNSGQVIDFERMKRDEAGRNLDKPTLNDLTWFIDEKIGYAQYVKVPDPGVALKADFEARLAQKKLDDLERWPDRRKSKDFDGERTSIEQALKNLDKQDKSYVRKDAIADNAASRFETAGQKLDTQIAHLDAFRIDIPTVSLAMFVANDIATIPLSNQQLVAIRNQQTSELKNGKKFSKKEAESLQTELTAWGAALKELDAFTGAPAKLSEPYQTVANDRRNKILKELLARVDKPPGAMSSLTAADAKVESDKFAKWCKTVTALATDLAAFKDNQIIELAAFKTFDAQWASSANPEQSNFWQTEISAPAGPLHAAAAPLLPRFDRLRAIEKADLAKLAADVIAPPDFTSAGKAETFLAGWQRLGGVGQFAAPLSIKELSNEAALRANLAAAREALDQNKLLASQKLKDDLASALKSGLTRWCNAFKAAASAQSIDALMTARGAFGVDDTTLTAPVTLGPTASYNACLWLTQQALAKNDPAIKTRLDSLVIVTAALPEPFMAHGGRLARWLNAQPCTPDLQAAFSAVLDQSAFCLGNQPPDLMAHVLAASGTLLQAKAAKPALLLSAGFHDREVAAVNANAAAWAKNFLDLANAFQAESDRALKITALKHGVKLEDPAAIAMLLQVAPKTAIDELTPVQATLDGTVLVSVAKVYEFGSGDKQVAASESSAREWYKLAAQKKSKEAEHWIEKHPDRGLTPVNVVATALPTGGVDVTWKWPHDQDAQFRVYRTSSLGGQIIAELTKAPIKETSFSDDSAPAGSTCFYKIAAVLKGVEGGTAPVSADPYPPKPSELLATPILAGGIKLTWKAVTDDSSLKGYIISRAATPMGPFARLTPAPVAGASYVDQQAPPGATSYYKITAVDKLREGIESNTPDATATTYLPTPANAHADMIAGGAIRVTWDAMTIPTAKNYAVYRANAKGEFAKLADVAKNKTLYEDPAPPPGVNFYAIAAIDALDREGSRASPSAESLAEVTGLTPALVGRKIVVKWSPALSANVAGYAVSRAKFANGPWAPLAKTKSRNDAEYEDAAPAEGANYYTVVAFNAGLVEGRPVRSSEIVFSRPSVTPVPTTIAAAPTKPAPGSEYYARGKEDYLVGKWAEARKDFNQAIALGYTEKPNAIEDSAGTFLARMDQKEKADKEKAEKERAEKAKADALAASKLPEAPDLTVAPLPKGGGIKLTWRGNDSTVTGYIVFRGGLLLKSLTKTDNEYTDMIRPGTYIYQIRAINGNGPGPLSPSQRATATEKLGAQ